MNVFIIFFLLITICSASDEYRSFLDYNHDEINLIRTLTFDSKKISNLEDHYIDEKYKASVYKEKNRLIISFSGVTQFEENENLDNMREFAEKIDLASYKNEVIISGNFYCSNLSLLFAESYLSFSTPHQHKVVLFGVPTFSDTSFYKKIIDKSKYKNDIIIFDYYRFMPSGFYEYPGLLIEITPRKYISDILNDYFATFCSMIKVVSFNLGSYYSLSLSKQLIQQFLIKSVCEYFKKMSTDEYNYDLIFDRTNMTNMLCEPRINFDKYNYCITLGGIISSIIFYNIVSHQMNKRLVPSEESVQESFLRFKGSYDDGKEKLENLGILSLLQALRL